MGLLDEPAFERLVGAGCPQCRSGKLAFRCYVDGLVPLMGAEPVGRVTWVYDGEKFVDGVFEITCADCKHVVFTADLCPRCHAAGGLATALATSNSWPVPSTCPSCAGDEVLYRAMMPARVTYEGKRADKARTTTELRDPGLHGLRVDCIDCGTVAAVAPDRCPLCAAIGALRERPGD
jgi:hypothetical protein